MSFRILSWGIWAFFFIAVLPVNPVAYIAMKDEVVMLSYAGNDHDILVISIIAASLIEIIISVIIRQFVLIRPFKRGTLTLLNKSGNILFVLIGSVNWFISCSVYVYGALLFMQTKRVEFLFIYSVMGIALMLFHMPGTGPLKAPGGALNT